MEAREALDKILMPKSVAVVGASTDPFKWGNMLLAALQKTGFEGDIYPVNPRAEEIVGLKCYANVRAIPDDWVPTVGTRSYTGGRPVPVAR